MIDHNTWQFINSFAPWLAAIGTLLAVILSLYLARRDRNIRLTVDAGLVVMVPDGGGSSEDIIMISATNIGHRSVVLTSIFWQVGIFKKYYYWQNPLGHPNSSIIPNRLNDGDNASFYFNKDNFLEQNRDNLTKNIPRFFKKLFAFSLKIGINTSAKKTIKNRVNKNLRDLLILNKDININ